MKRFLGVLVVGFCLLCVGACDKDDSENIDVNREDYLLKKVTMVMKGDRERKSETLFDYDFENRLRSVTIHYVREDGKYTNETVSKLFWDDNKIEKVVTREVDQDCVREYAFTYEDGMIVKIEEKNEGGRLFRYKDGYVYEIAGYDIGPGRGVGEFVKVPYDKHGNLLNINDDFQIMSDFSYDNVLSPYVFVGIPVVAFEALGIEEYACVCENNWTKIGTDYKLDKKDNDEDVLVARTPIRTDINNKYKDGLLEKMEILIEWGNPELFNISMEEYIKEYDDYSGTKRNVVVDYEYEKIKK